MAHQQEINYIIHLLKCSVSDEVPKEPAVDLDWDFIFKLAVKHRITSTLYFGIKKLSKDFAKEIPHLNSYISSYKMNLVSDANRAYELERLHSALSHLNIDYIFLKGSVIKNYYPHTSIRYMNDIDILFRGADFKVIDSIFENLGYKILHKDSKDTAYQNPMNKVVIEMQPHLIDAGYTRWYEYLEKIWEKCSHQDHEYKMNLEDFYIYHIIHMAKHFKNGGIGLIHMTDVFIMLKNFDIDWEYVDNQLKEIDLFKFNETIRFLISDWFDTELSENLNEKSSRQMNQKDLNIRTSKQMELLTKYILKGGAFGSKKQQEINHMISGEDKKLTIRKKIFPNMTTMINYYGQTLRRHKYLLPFYWIRLNLSRLLHFNQETKTTMNNITAITESEISEAEKIMDICGLK